MSDVHTTGHGHERWEDAVGAYLLDALAAGEREGFEAHMAICPTCRAEVEALQVAADALPVAVPQLEPPPNLKARIMAVVDSEADLLRAARGGPPAKPARKRDPWWRRGLVVRPALAAGAAAALLVVGGLVGVLAGAGGGGTERVVAMVDQRVAPDAEVALEVKDGSARLVASKLPEPRAGRVYQVWTQSGGASPEPTDTLFLPRDDGSAQAALPDGAADADMILVTSEPRGGSDEPSEPPFVAVSPA